MEKFSHLKIMLSRAFSPSYDLAPYYNRLLVYCFVTFFLTFYLLKIMEMHPQKVMCSIFLN
jgi:hypothetical protein